MSTKIFEDESFLKNVDKEMKKKIIVSIDTKAGVVLDRGWTDQTSLTAVDAIAKVEKAGIESAVITDISRDGTLSGPNIDLLTKVLTATHINIIASGGIASIDDIQSLHSLETKHKNLFGAIIGKALYENKIKLAEAIACAQ